MTLRAPINVPVHDRPFSFWRWLVRSLWLFALRSGAVFAALSTYLTAFGYDDSYKEAIAGYRSELAICLVIALMVNLMYDWEWSNEP